MLTLPASAYSLAAGLNNITGYASYLLIRLLYMTAENQLHYFEHFI